VSASLALRPANTDDAARLFAWANDPVARSVSFREAPIAWETHVAWLDAALTDPRRRLYIAESGGEAIGTARLDRDADDADVAIVSLNVAPEARGRGLGRALLDALAAEARVLGFARLRAFVKATNDASAKAFVATGYARVADVTIEGAAALRFERVV
jgi:RimJ/RimL family protein N-acetyltransferase